MAEPLWARYLPGIVAAVGGASLIRFSSSSRTISYTVLATLLGLVCMEAEYWVAHGFPSSEVLFFLGAISVTLATLPLGKLAGVVLGVAGFGFFAYVNLRYGAPYLLDYVMPALYTLLVFYSRRALRWFRPGVFRIGFLEAICFGLLQALVVWRTTALDKWGWLAGGPW